MPGDSPRSVVSYLDEIDSTTPEFVDLFDELPLWSAPFGLMLLARPDGLCGGP